MSNVPQWLTWARELQALAQTGLTFSQNDYDRQRYERLREIAAEIVARHAGLPEADLLRSFTMQPGYATPKVDVRAAAFSEGRILLVQERSDGRWCLPGGWADVGQAPAETAEREAWEESGFRVAARRVVGIYDANRTDEALELYHAYKIVFLCEIVGGAAAPSSETSAVGFFDLDHLPPLSERRTSLRHLQEAWAHLGEPGRATAFD
jgi:ADP-ribose pyrophosphatase YjhB (NUDIX family)